MHFQARERYRQETFRQRHWQELAVSPEPLTPARSSPGLLPRGHEAKAFFPPAAEGILAYGREQRFPVQAEARNLRSSLAVCLNILFPLRDRAELARLALEPVLPGLACVQRIEFLFPHEVLSARWSASGEDTAAEAAGCRCDAAIWWENRCGQRCLSLCCWSYTESSYGTCGGFRSRDNPNQGACLYFPAVDPDRSATCYLSSKKHPWLCWERLPEAGVSLDAVAGVAGCPFRGPFYQLLRYTMLAAMLRRTEDVDQVDVVVAGFRDNTLLNLTPRHLAVLGYNIVPAWNRLLSGVPPLRCVHVEDIVAGLRRDRSDEAMAHVRYLEERYGFN